MQTEERAPVEAKTVTNGAEEEDLAGLVAEAEAKLASLRTRAEAARPEAPTPAPIAAVAEVVPVGRAVDCDPVAAKPGEIVQLVMPYLPAGTVLRGLVLAPGLRVATVIVGRQMFPVPNTPNGRWEDCYGTVVPTQSFLILLVENVTREHQIARATWYVTGDGVATLPASVQPANTYAAPAGSPAAPVVPAAVAAHDGHGGSHGHGQGLNLAPPVQGSPVPQAVVPGTNEVCILIQRSECERLLASVLGGPTITDHERPSIARQLDAALKR